MKKLWFVVPASGRVELARICLQQLRHTCDELIDNGIAASAVIIADDENLKTARRLGFATIKRNNRYLSRKFNDGIQFACDRRYNPHPVDYVVPCGSDDWVDYRILLDLPYPDTVVGFQHLSFVREDGGEIVSRKLDNVGGCGIRIYPRQQLAPFGYRPADEDRVRACDTSIMTNLLSKGRRLTVVHREIDPRQIVDWKSPSTQLNPYETLRRHKPIGVSSDPFLELHGFYPAESLEAMELHYSRKLVAA